MSYVWLVYSYMDNDNTESVKKNFTQELPKQGYRV